MCDSTGAAKGKEGEESDDEEEGKDERGREVPFWSRKSGVRPLASVAARLTPSMAVICSKQVTRSDGSVTPRPSTAMWRGVRPAESMGHRLAGERR